jgi:hypothetical protein
MPARCCGSTETVSFYRDTLIKSKEQYFIYLNLLCCAHSQARPSRSGRRLRRPRPPDLIPLFWPRSPITRARRRWKLQLSRPSKYQAAMFHPRRPTPSSIRLSFIDLEEALFSGGGSETRPSLWRRRSNSFPSAGSVVHIPHPSIHGPTRVMPFIIFAHGSLGS